MRILDLSAGNRAIWYKKHHPLCTYLDRRASVNPDIVCDTRDIPVSVTGPFDLFVFDPPHAKFGPNSDMGRAYGSHTTDDILSTVSGTSKSAWHLSHSESLMAFKWNDCRIRLQRVLDLMPHWEPLFGHLTKDGPSSASQTYWVMLLRREKPVAEQIDIFEAKE